MEIPSLFFMILFLIIELALAEIAAVLDILKIHPEIVLFSINELLVAYIA